MKLATKPFKNYFNRLAHALELIPHETLVEIAGTISRSNMTYVAGNGGSAAIANHFECDFAKGLRPERFIRVESLSANSSMLTAIGNDLGYENTVKFQLEGKGLQPQDAVILISSSGNSPNIVQAAQYVKESTNCTLISFTGFDGGKLKPLSDLNIHIPSDSYGVVEDSHQACMHAIAYYIKTQLK